MAIQAALQTVPRMSRVPRRPQHTFQIRCRPWEITPFMIAPVLPGETLKNLLCQTRAVSDPVKSSLLGWWFEQYWFYCKHRDLDGRTDFANMMIDPATSLAGYNRAANVITYHAGTTIDWTWECYKRVVDCYFRDQGETYATSQFASGLSVAKAHQHDASWLNSVTNEDPLEADDPSLTVGGDDIVRGSEVENLLRQWELLRLQNLTNQTYEEYLATFGVSMPQTEEHKPELIRYVRDWKYPTNTIDPTSGAARSALVWNIAERADKDRFFREPGFILGVCVVRPKIYLQNQKGAAVLALTDAYKWLPAVLAHETGHSWREYAAGAGPLQATTDGYYMDCRDLFLYGDQFINYALTETDSGIIGLPTAALQKAYPASADADELFVSASPANQIRMDGICSLNILGTQVDRSP